MTTSPRKVQEFVSKLTPNATVLDVVGGKYPRLTATHVIDFLPYEKSAHFLDRAHGEGDPHFSADTWFQCNIDHEPLPFEDDAFDFVFCTHTLEDIANPQFALSEISRVGKAGFCETPSILWELIMGIQLDTIVGAPHHKWYVEVDKDANEFIFTPKGGHCYLSPEHHLPREMSDAITDENACVGLFWEGSISLRTNLMIDYVENVEWLKAKVKELKS